MTEDIVVSESVKAKHIVVFAIIKQRTLSPMNHAIGFWQLVYNEKSMDS